MAIGVTNRGQTELNTADRKKTFMHREAGINGKRERKGARSGMDEG